MAKQLLKDISLLISFSRPMNAGLQQQFVYRLTRFISNGSKCWYAASGIIGRDSNPGPSATCLLRDYNAWRSKPAEAIRM